MKQNRFVFRDGEVWEAYLRVKSNQGAAGLDGQSTEETAPMTTAGESSHPRPPRRYGFNPVPKRSH